ncbi:MAG: site-2 protease family protein [Chloroflexi bacterium]|nr:site-2 protease family protein [Chloroflexota bacterium]
MQIEGTSRTSFVQYDILPLLEGLIEPLMIDRQTNGTIVVRGRLLTSAEQVYRPLRARFERIGYTPFLRPHADGVELIAAPMVIERRPQRWRLNLVLFLATVISVLSTGALNEMAVLAEANGTAFQPGELLRDPALLALGLPFMATLLGILFTHEMGHYVVGRWRGAPASLPYFIPMPPFISITGTLGAVIVQREPFEDRRTLLEVAVAGPLAGLVVAIPLLFYGLSTSQLGAPVPGHLMEGNSLFYALSKFWVFGQWLPGAGMDVQLNSVAWGAWIGLLVTMFNLLPVGQLDGGHISYALFGEKAEWLAYAMMLLCLGLGIFVATTWLVWVILIALMGPRHPAPFNDVVQLRPAHTVLGVIGLIAFVLLFVPNPLTLIS